MVANRTAYLLGDAIDLADQVLNGQSLKISMPFESLV